MKLVKKQLFGVNITTNLQEEILDEITKYLQGSPEVKKRSPYVVVTPNSEQLVYGRDYPDFAKLLNRADTALPDGMGIVFAMKVLFHTSLLRISGVDFMGALVRLSHKYDWKIALVGGKQNAASHALSSLQSSYIGLHGWALELPELEVESTNLQMKNLQMNMETNGETESLDELVTRIARKIVEGETKIVFVGLGAPKQEYFIELLQLKIAHIKLRHPVALMSVGGSFDMIAGHAPRAPKFLQTLGFEWLYRLVREPWRWKRQIALIRFVGFVLQEFFVKTRKKS